MEPGVRRLVGDGGKGLITPVVDPDRYHRIVYHVGVADISRRIG